jgi:hypothetical protein
MSRQCDDCYFVMMILVVSKVQVTMSKVNIYKSGSPTKNDAKQTKNKSINIKVDVKPKINLVSI